MKNKLIAKRVGLLMAGLLAMLGSASVYADAGDTISNTATINYSVGGTAQTAIESSPTGNTTAGVGNGTSTDFIEDRVINFTVAETSGGTDTGAPGSTTAMAFTVTNNSNSTLDFLLAAIDTDVETHGGGADDFDATNVSVFVEDGTTAGYQAAEDTAVFVDELAEGANVTVYIVGDIPGAQPNGTTAGYALVAQAAAGGTDSIPADEALIANAGAEIMRDDNGNISPAGTFGNTGNNRTTVAVAANDVADTTGSMDTVFNDPAGAATEDESTAAAQDIARNGQASDSDSLTVGAAILTVTKSSSVISDPVNGTTNPKAIPGAIVEYTVTVANGAGAATATSVALSDSLNTEITNGTLAYETGSFDAQGTCPGGGAPNPCGILVTAPDINAGVAQAITNTNGDADGGDFTTNVINMNVGNLDAGESATIQFRVSVQ